MHYDWIEFRSRFPALESRCYLNTAGGGVMSRQVAAAANRYYTEAVEEGDVCWNRWVKRSDEDRAFVAQTIGCSVDAVAFLQNASLGFNIAALSIKPEAVILALDAEFPSCTTPFIRAGHTVRFVPVPSSGYIDASQLKRAIIDTKPSVFVLSSVQFANGFNADLQSLGQVCRDLGVHFIVDATQSIGAFDVHMGRDSIDVLIFSGYKWATAGYGNAVFATGPHWLQVNPPLIGWRSAHNAYDLVNNKLDLIPSGIGHEMGHPPFPGIFTMAEALRLMKEPPAGAISERIRELTGYLRQGLHALGIPIRSHTDPHHYSGITLAEMKNASRVKKDLEAKNIWVTARQGGLRISVHAYNDTQDIDWFLSELGLCAF